MVEIERRKSTFRSVRRIAFKIANVVSLIKHLVIAFTREGDEE